MNQLFLQVDTVSGESRDANHQNLIVHAAVDKSTPTIFRYGSNGNRIKKVKISACKAGRSPMEYYRITLENVFVAGVMLTESGVTSVLQYEL